MLAATFWWVVKTPIVLPQREHHEHYSRQAAPAEFIEPVSFLCRGDVFKSVEGACKLRLKHFR